MKNPYPRKPTQTKFTTIAAIKPAAGHIRLKDEIRSEVKGNSDVEDGTGAATIFVKEIILGHPFFYSFASEIYAQTLTQACKTRM